MGEVYILDSLYRRIGVVDDYESLIWTERATAWGDFEMDMLSTPSNKKKFKPGILLGKSGSRRIMILETAQDETNQDGQKILKLTGRSIEKVLGDRLLMYIGEITGWQPWFVFGHPYDKVLEMFQNICIDGVLDPDDVIPGIVVGSGLYPADTIPQPTDSLAYTVDPTTLYEGMKTIADAYSIGFRIVQSPVTSQLYFDVYMGCDRTTDQTVLPAVVFSPDLGNLNNTKELTSSAQYKNVAYVIYNTYHEIVFALDVDPDVTGFERNILYVSVTSLETTDPTEISAQLIQRGQAELAKHRNFTVLDGEVSSDGSYVYEVDYNLNDLVELRNASGETSQMRVTEHIFVSDKSGERSYPTLAIETFITPGSWLGVPPTLEWEDYTTEHWGELE